MKQFMPNKVSRRTFLQGAAALALSSKTSADSGISSNRKYKINGNMVIPPFVGDSLDEDIKAKFKTTELSAFKLSLGGSHGTYEQCKEILDSLPSIYSSNPDVFMHVNSSQDLSNAYDDEKIGIIYSFETMTMIGEKLDRIKEFSDLGIRIMQPGYNHSNSFGAGVLSTEEPLGLSELGRQAIELMQSNSVLVDLSHAHERTATDIIRQSIKPVAMTHTGCFETNAHPRNKSDALLKKVANTGGVTGIYEMSYLTSDLAQQSLAAFMRHVMHAINVSGVEHVGIGSDTPILGFDTSEQSIAEWDEINRIRKETGVAAPGEGPPPYVTGMNGPHKMNVFEHQLRKRGLKGEAIDKILGQNFARVFKDALQ